MKKARLRKIEVVLALAAVAGFACIATYDRLFSGRERWDGSQIVSSRWSHGDPESIAVYESGDRSQLLVSLPKETYVIHLKERRVLFMTHQAVRKLFGFAMVFPSQGVVVAKGDVKTEHDPRLVVLRPDSSPDEVSINFSSMYSGDVSITVKS